MKKKCLLSVFITLFCLIFTPGIVSAADASASNWHLFCDKSSVIEGETVKCYLITQITDATSNGNKISSVLTNVETSKDNIEAVKPAFNYMTVETTLASAPFTTTSSLHGSNTNCPTTGNCYDFISASGIVSNTNNPTISAAGYTGYTPIGYWEIKLDAKAITSNDDCGSICVSLDYIVDGRVTAGNMANPSNTNSSCAEVKLSLETTKICYCNTASNICYGKNGTDVSKGTYEKECLKACYQSGGKYYGKDGTEVSKETYEEECLPNTGSFASYAVLAAKPFSTAVLPVG